MMLPMPRFVRWLMVGAVFAGGAAFAGEMENLNLPPGFKIELYAKAPGARSMAVVPALDAVFVGSRGESVYVIRDRGLKGRAQAVETLIDGLNVPNGVAWRDGYLYVAEQRRVIRLPVSKGIKVGKPETLFAGLPDKSWHGWRYAAFGPDGALYVAVGAPCNICKVSGLEGTIVRFDPQTWKPEVYASGVRNSVGLDFHPLTGELYFTDNGADWMGDDDPPDELNRAPRPGMHFGFPWFGGGAERTPDFLDQAPPAPSIAPVVSFNAHVASLGVHFYRGKQFPKAYRTDAFVAQHGSWNRAVPDGYRVMRIKMDAAGKVLGREVFADGWLTGEDKWGRPVDVKELPGGSLLVSDDYGGAVYRISYEGG